MILSFFSKSKPINYAVLVALLLFFYVITLLLHPVQEMTYSRIPISILAFMALVSTLFIINRMMRIANVKDLNAYPLLFFVLLLAAFPNTLIDNDIIFANFFLILALHRLLAMASLKQLKHKVFDASFLLGFSSLFYDWILVFFVLIFWNIKVYHPKNFKTWFVPFAGIASVFVIVFAFLQLYDSLSFFQKHYQFSIRFLPTVPLAEQISIKALTYTTLILLLAVVVFVRMRNISRRTLVLFRFAFLTFILGIVDMLTTAANPLSCILLTFFPASVFMTYGLGKIKNQKTKSITLSASFMIFLLLFVLQIWQ